VRAAGDVLKADRQFVASDSPRDTVLLRWSRFPTRIFLINSSSKERESSFVLSLSWCAGGRGRMLKHGRKSTASRSRESKIYIVISVERLPITSGYTRWESSWIYIRGAYGPQLKILEYVTVMVTCFIASDFQNYDKQQVQAVSVLNCRRNHLHCSFKVIPWISY
jgi:hypothetical protein